jgi:hypothetical protein
MFDLRGFDPKTTLSDYNVFHHFGKPLRVFYEEYKGSAEGIISWDAWQGKGFDRHSLVADPLFQNPEEDDYQLRDESPAFSLGFERIPTDKIGLFEDELRASWPVARDERKEGIQYRSYTVSIRTAPAPPPQAG